MKDKEEAKKELKERYMELQLMNQQIKQMQKQIEAIEAQRMELFSINQSLDDLKNVKENAEAICPIGSGIFVKANLQNPQDLIVNVGANVAVKKGVSETKKLVEKHLNEITNVHEQAVNELQQYAARAMSIEEEMSHIAKSQQ